MNENSIKLCAVLLAAVVMCGNVAVPQEPGSRPEQSATQPGPEQPAPQTQPPAQPSESSGQQPSPTQQIPPADVVPPYQPKFPGDPARSEDEAKALGYMRVVLRAQREYKKRHSKYAQTLMDLAGTGSLTRRMARTTERGEYSVGFKAEKEGFVLTMTPKQMDAQHRSFYAEEDGVIHGDDQKPADADSPKVK